MRKTIEEGAFGPIGFCIYCGDDREGERLTKEHVIPKALGGRFTLLRSSCVKCAAITSKSERSVLRGTMWPARVASELPSRSKFNDAPQTYPLEIVRNGNHETIEVPRTDYPVLMTLPRFSSSRPNHRDAPLQLAGWATLSFGPTPEEVCERLGVESMTIPEEFAGCGVDPTQFARMIAKIAYSYAHCLGLCGNIDREESVVPAILGERGDIGWWIGEANAPGPRLGHLHRLYWNNDQGLLKVSVQLFANAGAPEYCVIVGRSDPRASTLG